MQLAERALLTPIGAGQRTIVGRLVDPLLPLIEPLLPLLNPLLPLAYPLLPLIEPLLSLPGAYVCPMLASLLPKRKISGGEDIFQHVGSRQLFRPIAGLGHFIEALCRHRDCVGRSIRAKLFDAAGYGSRIDSLEQAAQIHLLPTGQRHYQAAAGSRAGSPSLSASVGGSRTCPG